MPPPEGHALTQSPINKLHNPRKKRRNELVPIPHKWFEVLGMHLSGVKTKEIAEQTGYSLGYLYTILNSERTQAVRQQLLSMYQDEYEALFEKVIDNIRDQLDSEDHKVQQTAQQQWLNSEKKFRGLQSKNIPGETAEDLVGRMLNVNVQVNVDKDGQST